MTFSSLAFRLGSSGIELSLGFAKNQNTQDLIHDVASTLTLADVVESALGGACFWEALEALLELRVC